MSFFEKVKNWLLQLELHYVRKTPFLNHIPILRFINRKISADFTILKQNDPHGICFSIDFHSPYLKLPLAVEKSQVGRISDNGLLQTASFRFFDWHSWIHIDGNIDWRGERISIINGINKEFVTGFSYTVPAIPADSENLGIRLAEGVAGTIRVLIGDEIAQLGFEPAYWMLEPGSSGYKTVAICDKELMVLIVSLSEIGSGKTRLYALGVEHLYQWLYFKFGRKSKERMMIEFLKYVRDWGPLGMEPLFRGLKDVILRIGLERQEQVIFEFFADNWGLHNNWHGRLLAIKILDALATERAYSALSAIFDYVKNRDIEPDELNIICQIMRRISKRPELLESAPCQRANVKNPVQTTG